MERTALAGLACAFRGLRLSVSGATPLRPTSRLSNSTSLSSSALSSPLHDTPTAACSGVRQFSTTRPALGNWLEPNLDRSKKMAKGRPRVATGGSAKGTTVIWGDYGLRMRDHHRRISAKQLKTAEDVIKARLRGEKFRLYKRVCCNIGVYTKGNDVRMGKGKGSFDYWAARVAVSQIVLELRGMIHEKVARDAFRLAGQKLPGQYDFVKKGSPAVVGITPLKGVTLEELKLPKRKPEEPRREPSSPLPVTPDEITGMEMPPSASP